MMNTIYLTETDYQRLHQVVQLQRQTSRPQVSEALSKELKRARIMPSTEIPSDVITMNSVVQIKEIKSATEMEIKIVYPKEANLRRKVSILAPLGTAILGCRVGDEVDWQVLDNLLTYKVEKIIYQPEAAGDLHL
jgi:regulator of nucleoside diphosphate kinase